MKREKPVHPGKVFKERYLKNRCIVTVAEDLGVTRQTVFQLIGEKRGLSVEMAIRIARASRTDVYEWMKMQLELDLWNAEQKEFLVKDGCLL